MIEAPPKHSKSSDERILPLINIVFLLLIFFMLAGGFAHRPPFALTPPTTQAAQHSTRLVRRVLSVDAQGQLAFGGKTLTQKQLAGALVEWPQDKILQVRADGQLKIQKLDVLLATLRGAGIDEINLLTRHRGS